MRIVTWNVNGLRKRESEVIDLANSQKPDVMCLQEIKCNPEQIPPGLSGLIGLPEYASYWHGNGGYSGVSIHLLKSRFEGIEFGHPTFDNEARIVEAKSGDFTFVSMYVPNGGKDFQAKMDFLKELAAWANTVSDRKTILCGDMNVARAEIDVHKTQRNARAIGQRPDERELFEKFLHAGLVDAGRKLHPSDDAMFTWWPYWNNARKRNVGWRLDLVVATEPLAAKAKSHTVLYDFGLSDHAPVVVDFDL
jgi:exodeoxyribonuclease-3